MNVHAKLATPDLTTSTSGYHPRHRAAWRFDETLRIDVLNVGTLVSVLIGGQPHEGITADYLGTDVHLVDLFTTPIRIAATDTGQDADGVPVLIADEL